MNGVVAEGCCVLSGLPQTPTCLGPPPRNARRGDAGRNLARFRCAHGGTLKKVAAGAILTPPEVRTGNLDTASHDSGFSPELWTHAPPDWGVSDPA